MQFEDIYTESNRRLVEAVCRRILRNREDAQDAAQDTFLKAFRAWETFRGDCAVTTWLHRIARNKALECKRSQREMLSLDEPVSSTSGRNPIYAVQDTYADLLPAPGLSPEMQMLFQEVVAAVNHLYPLMRVPMQLKLEGYTPTQIASAMMISVICVKARLFRAQRALRAVLDQES